MSSAETDWGWIEMLYEFITPSDQITFKTENPLVAFYVATVVGNGKAGCHNENGDDVGSMFLFDPDPLPKIESKLGDTTDGFLEKNMAEIISCLRSFAYGNFASRKEYDWCIEAITDDTKLREFKEKHDDLKRTSLSKWVKYAWGLADKLEEKKEGKN